MKRIIFFLMSIAYLHAQEKGFYKDGEFDVEIKSYNYGLNRADAVLMHEATYQKSDTLYLTEEEQKFLTKKRELQVCIQPNIFPIDGMQDGNHTGIVGDIYALISEKLHINFIFIDSKNNIQLNENIKNKKCELISTTISTLNETTNMVYSNPLTSSYMALISKIDKPFYNDSEALIGKTIFVQNNQYKDYILNINRQLKVEVIDDVEIFLNSDNACLALPNESAEWFVQKYGIGTIKVNGFLGKEKPLFWNIGILLEEKLLINILNKTLASIPDEVIRQIKDNWTLESYIKPANYSLVVKISAFFFLIFLAFLYRNRILKRVNIDLETNINKKTAELQKSIHLLETVFNSTKESIGIVDSNLMFIFANKAYFEMTGYNEEELYKKSCTELTFSDDILITLDAINTLKDKNYITNVIKRCIKKDGNIFETKMSIVAMHHMNNYLIISTDITEENIRKKENERQKALLLENSRLAQMGEMIAMIAHQWRQPLAAIANATINMKVKLEIDNLSLDAKDKIYKNNIFLIDKIDTIESYIENLSNTIDDFKNFHKKDKNTVMISFEDIVIRVLNIVRNSIEINNITLIENYQSKVLHEMYENEMMQVILNILQNAQDNFIEKKISNAQILIQVHENTLSICDNGGGVPIELIDKIFNPYFSTKHEKNGTGLGLYMSKIIIEEHHKARLTMKNQEDGVCFEIRMEK